MDPGQSVQSKGGSVCLHIKQRARERKETSQREICVKERQPRGSKCFDKFSERRSQTGQWEQRQERERERETFLSVLSGSVLSFLVSAGTAVSFSYHTAPGSAAWNVPGPVPAPPFTWPVQK